MKKTIGYGVAAFLLVAFAPVLLRVIGGVYFLPSADWAARAGAIGTYGGIAVGVALAALVVARRKTNPKLADVSVFKLGWVALGLVLLGWTAGQQFVVFSIPMAQAAVAGDEIALPYTVEKPRDRGSRGCRPAIRLRDMPFMGDELCGPPPALSAQLSPGMTVYAVGKGTSLGVYYDGFSLTGQ